MVLWTLFPCVLSWIGVTQKKWIICRGTLLQKFCCFYVSHNWLKTKISSSFESKWILQEKAIHTWKRWLSFSSFSLFPCSPSLTMDDSSLICHTNRVLAKETLAFFFLTDFKTVSTLLEINLQKWHDSAPLTHIHATKGFSFTNRGSSIYFVIIIILNQKMKV